jgi:hypothetical protein
LAAVNTSDSVCYGEGLLCCHPHLNIHSLNGVVTQLIKTGVAAAEVVGKGKAARILGSVMATTDSDYLASRRVGVLDLRIIWRTSRTNSLSSARRACEYQFLYVLIPAIMVDDLVSDWGERVIPRRKVTVIIWITVTSPDLRICKNCPRVVPHAFKVENWGNDAFGVWVWSFFVNVSWWKIALKRQIWWYY